MTARVVLHIHKAFHGTYRTTNRMIMFKLIDDIITSRGGEVVISGLLGARAQTPPSDNDLHVVESGFMRAPGWLNANLAYITGYWHLGPRGALTAQEMDARGDLVPDFGPNPHSADDFFAKLVARFVDKRRSRYIQPALRTDLPKGGIAVFLQGPSPEKLGYHYFTAPEIIEAVARGAGGRAVMIKPHPLWHDSGLAQIRAAQDQGLNVMLADAHVHDILAACDVSVSINSAASFEGFLHKKPAIICGRADFAPLAETLLDPDDFAQTLNRALATPRSYAPWMQWYLTQHALPIDTQNSAAQILDLFAAAGFDGARLGLTI